MTAEPIHLPNATPFDLLSEHLNDLIAEARNFADGEPVTTPGQDEAVKTLIESLFDAAKDADAERVRENEPHDRAKAAVQAKYAPLIADPKNKVPGIVWTTIDALKACRKPYLDTLEAQKREAERLAHEAADKAAHEAREALLAADRANMAEREDAEAKVRQAEAAEKTAKQAAADKVKGFRTYHVARVTDRRAALAHYYGINPEAFDGFVQGLADADARAGKRSGIPGVSITAEQRL